MSQFTPRRGPKRSAQPHRIAPASPTHRHHERMGGAAPAQPQTAPQPSAPAPQPAPPAKKPRNYLLWGTVAASVALGAFVIYWLAFQEGGGYKPTYVVDVEIVRELPAQAPGVPVDEYFSLNNRDMMANQGKGVRIKFVTREKGRDDKTDIFEFKPWPTWEATLPDQRQKDIATAKEQLGEYVARFQGDPDAKFRQEITAVDDTSGVDEKLADQVNFYFKTANLYGPDNTMVRFHRLASTNFSEGRSVEIKAKSAPGSKSSEITLALNDWLIKPRGTAPESPLAAGLLTIAAEAKVDKDSHMSIFSDGIENTDNLTFEKGKYYDAEYLANPTNWDEVDKKIDEPIKKLRGSTPSLNGCAIDWYTPPLEPGKADRAKVVLRIKVIRAAMVYWRHYLVAHGAGQVTMH